MRLLLCVACVLSACTQATPTIQPQPVLLPIDASCSVPPLSEPDWNMPHVVPTASANEKLSAILADLELSKAYIAELKAELAACS